MYIFPKYVSAFLNGNGGAIYFGIADDGRIHGIRVDRCVRLLALDRPIGTSARYLINHISTVHAAM
jgi:hypothetical protein